MHGVYDAFLFASDRQDNPSLIAGALAVLIAGAVVFRTYVRRLQALSPFREGAEATVCNPCRRVLV